MEYQTRYFDESGGENTKTVLKLVQDWADRLDISNILVASTSGETGFQAVKAIQHHQIIVVSHSAGFREADLQEMDSSRRKAIEDSGGRVLTCQHAFGGVGRALRLQYNTHSLEEFIANTLRVFGQGMKVIAEITLMAADAGWIDTTHDIIAVGGSGQGADTAAVIRPANATRFFNLKIRGILCKPWDF
ncbi:hypothetical protein JW835_07945 [bacterium]|nr:hypothetical protein [bacterium]